MQNLKILNTREARDVVDMLKEQYGFDGELNYAFLENNKNKIYLVNKDISRIDFKKLRINSIGLYFGEVNNGKVRLSIEGSQLIGKNCDKNIVELDYQESREWLKGTDIPKDIESREFVLLKHDEDFLGCGKAVDKKILNYVPKNRRIRSSD